MREVIKATPGIGPLVRRAVRSYRKARFPGSADYWERRYLSGGNSGAGSYGETAEYKAAVLNAFVREHSVESVIEWGCGDGHQLSLAEYSRYIGLDVADAAVELCMAKFRGDPSKSFYGVRVMADNHRLFRADLALSLEVIFHLVEDEVFSEYMRRLFDSAERYVVIYATDEDRGLLGPHERRRAFTPWVAAHAPHWRFVEQRTRPGKTNVYESDFFVFERTR